VIEFRLRRNLLRMLNSSEPAIDGNHEFLILD
jgi:hypothetical protein